MFVKGEAVIGFPFGMVYTSGLAYTDTTPPVGYITKDGGVQSTLLNVCTHEGNGQWSTNITSGEMNASVVGIIFTAANCVPVHFTLETTTPEEASLIEQSKAPTGLLSSSFTQIADDICVLKRNLTGNMQVSLRERQIVEGSVNEAMAEISYFQFGKRPIFLDTEHTLPLESGTSSYLLKDTVSSVASTAFVHILDGSMTLGDEHIMLNKISTEEMDALLLSDDDPADSKPRFWSASTDTDNGPDYIRLKFYPIPDDTYTVYFKARKIIAETAVNNIPAGLSGALVDLGTAIAMRRLGFGNSSEYRAMGERALRNYGRMQDGDGPLHIARGVSMYGGGGIQHRANQA
jgi:hypothetical protein